MSAVSESMQLKTFLYLIRIATKGRDGHYVAKYDWTYFSISGLTDKRKIPRG